MNITLLEPTFTFSDARGRLDELIKTGCRQINVVRSYSGAFRGGHYHKRNSETFFVISGEFEFIAEKGGVKENFIFKGGDMFTVPPYTTHCFNYTEDTILVALYDKGVENNDGTMDTYPTE